MNTCTNHNDRQRAECTVCLVAALTAECDELRDKVKSLKKQIKDDNFSYGCELRDPYGTIWEQATADHARAENAVAAETVALAKWNGALERAMKAEADLATERARLDWLQAQEVKRGLEITEGHDDPLPFLVLDEDGTTHWGDTYRAAIDAAMKKDVPINSPLDARP